MVRLLHSDVPPLPDDFNGFNPTMVRLLLSHQRRPTSLASVSIPQWCDCCLPSDSSGFMSPRSFNPTMVRLLLYFAPRKGAFLSFQSHNGAIAAEVCVARRFIRDRVSIPQWCDCCQKRKVMISPRQPSFNPTMVRLLPCTPSV